MRVYSERYFYIAVPCKALADIYKLLFTYRVTMMQKAAKLSLKIYSIPRLRDNYVIYLQL